MKCRVLGPSRVEGTASADVDSILEPGYGAWQSPSLGSTRACATSPLLGTALATPGHRYGQAHQELQGCSGPSALAEISVAREVVERSGFRELKLDSPELAAGELTL